MSVRRRISIFDTTLRDGEQSPGIALQPDEKAAIAEQLERLGVDVVEAGFPGASPGDFEGVRAVAAAVERPTVAALARARQEDSTPPARRSPAPRRSRIHVFLATSPVHMEHKLGLEPSEVVAAGALGGRVRGPSAPTRSSSRCEDATRSDPDFVARVCRVAIEAGATVINLPDTVGYALPDQYATFIAGGPPALPGARAASRSPSTATTTSGSRSRTRSPPCRPARGQVECTVNGIGERAGNASLEEIVVALRVQGRPLRRRTRASTATQIAASSRLVSRLTGYVVQPNKAIVGANAFAHEAGIHQDGMLKDERTYQIIDPRDVGVRMTLPLGKHSGRHAFARACAERGIAARRRPSWTPRSAVSRRSPTRRARFPSKRSSRR